MRAVRFAVLLGALLALLLPGSAGAAVVFGSNLSLPPSTNLCFKSGASVSSCTTAITGLPVASRAPGGVLAPVDGVITSWSVRAGSTPNGHSVRLRIVRSDTGVRSGPTVTLLGLTGIHIFKARLPVDAGDMLAIDTLGVAAGTGPEIIRTTTGAYVDQWIGPLADGETRVPTANEATPIELLMNATIEPDADGDEFGDETQDECPSDATTPGPCPTSDSGGTGDSGGGGAGPSPLPPATLPVATAPETILGKRPAGTIHSRKATFRFNANVAGSTFQCKLDKKPFRSCSSPKTYKGLAEGRHTFKVRAVGPSGLVDPTPGKRAFKVEL